jgi:hypothetical protein
VEGLIDDTDRFIAEDNVEAVGTRRKERTWGGVRIAEEACKRTVETKLGDTVES